MSLSLLESKTAQSASNVEDVSATDPRWHTSPSRLIFQAILAIVTFLSATGVGMRYMYNFRQGLFPLMTPADIFPYHWIFNNLDHFSDGLPFSLTLLGILLSHEFGHYLFCRRHDIPASLPYLLPTPTLSGTSGAIIRMRVRISSRVALLNIGASGPICGFLFAVPCAIAGLMLSRPMSPEIPAPMMQFNAPLLLIFLQKALHLYNPATPELLQLVPHPMLVASWIGLFITFLNLIPAGQLDGGHVLYAISPSAHKIVTNVVILLLILAGTSDWLGWIFWAFLLMLPGMRHPVIESREPLKLRHYLAAATCAVIFFSTAVLEPFFLLNPVKRLSLLDFIRFKSW